MDLPEDVQISARTVGYDTVGVYPDYEVWEEVQSGTSDDATTTHRRPEFSSIFLDLWDDGTPREALEVIPESVEVHHVNKVRMECTPFIVVRRRKQRRKDERF
ncbi:MULTISPECIES: hypothetical protein [unclassified Pseudomonas]|uniref:hypothetical protein n=1 Tax=unclassified Pseudomonas TaxID=196821 RepID=UPI00126A37CB|nr:MULTISPECIES: hypothetical protein [unclassified Pseudomonas]NTX92719.1 hypothetical protein [Pseudomonas sp. UMA643]NTY19921.1 hypothetical protein [Pseudomonas sp. UMC3103]NTY27330.1 hypothetical protein [Pseudomonas sp. UMA603]NTY33285.1 hypothetical protein [Pseudomonas sp. UMC3129]NUA32721.1 hypothetical protein [Pseudomonas sp. UMA601]